MVAVGVLISINSLSNNPFKPKGKADDLPILTVDHWEFIWVDLPVTVDVLQTWLKQQQQQTAPKSNRQSGQWTADLAHAFFFFFPPFLFQKSVKKVMLMENYLWVMLTVYTRTFKFTSILSPCSVTSLVLNSHWAWADNSNGTYFLSSQERGQGDSETIGRWWLSICQ